MSMTEERMYYEGAHNNIKKVLLNGVLALSLEVNPPGQTTVLVMSFIYAHLNLLLLLLLWCHIPGGFQDLYLLCAQVITCG